MRTRSATTPRGARTAILAIWVWQVWRKRRKCHYGDFQICFWRRFRGLLTTERRKRRKGGFGDSSVARVHVTVDCQSDTLARNSQKDNKARSAANQQLPSDWRFCKCGLVIPRWLPTRFAQALIEDSGEQNRKGDFGDHKIPSPPFSNPPPPLLSSPELFFEIRLD